MLGETFCEKTTEFQSHAAQPVTKNDRSSNRSCMQESEIADTLQRLATSTTRAQRETILTKFRDSASQSVECRKQVVERLIAALNESDRDLLLNQESFFLWHLGSKLLVDRECNN